MPWPGDWRPHRQLTAAMLGDQTDRDRETETERDREAQREAADEEGEEDSPLALTQRLLHMSAVKHRASAAWEAAQDVAGRAAR